MVNMWNQQARCDSPEPSSDPGCLLWRISDFLAQLTSDLSVLKIPMSTQLSLNCIFNLESKIFEVPCF